MTDVHPSIEKLCDAKLTAYKDEYATHVRIWADLERKAQAMTAIAGTFVAAANALPTATDFRSVILGPAAAMVGILLLGVCALRSIQALSVRPVLVASADEVARSVRVGIAKGTDYQTIANTHSAQWPDVIAEVEKANRSKASHLHDAEALLGCAISIFTLIGIVRFGFMLAPIR